MLRGPLTAKYWEQGGPACNHAGDEQRWSPVSCQVACKTPQLSQTGPLNPTQRTGSGGDHKDCNRHDTQRNPAPTFPYMFGNLCGFEEVQRKILRQYEQRSEEMSVDGQTAG